LRLVDVPAAIKHAQRLWRQIEAAGERLPQAAKLLGPVIDR
jgi:hypothetical protein